jgi:hypothetical protein
LSNIIIIIKIVYDGQQSLPPAPPPSNAQLEKQQQQQNKNRKNTRELMIDTECNEKINKIQMPTLSSAADVEHKVIFFFLFFSSLIFLSY